MHFLVKNTLKNIRNYTSKHPLKITTNFSNIKTVKNTTYILYSLFKHFSMISLKHIIKRNQIYIVISFLAVG